MPVQRIVPILNENEPGECREEDKAQCVEREDNCGHGKELYTTSMPLPARGVNGGYDTVPLRYVPTPAATCGP